METKKTETIDWFYPEIYDKENLDYLEVNLYHTRASDGIRIKYESDRDGFIIEQPIWKNGERKEWKETCFLKSWAFDDDDEEKN